MANNWINHCKNYAKEHGIKYNDALKSMDCKKSYKNGAGFGDVLKKVATSDTVKNLAKSGIDYGVQKLKDKIDGKGLFGDIGKTVLRTGLNYAPIPNMARDIVGNVGEKLIDKTGVGIKRRKKKGMALYP